MKHKGSMKRLKVPECSNRGKSFLLESRQPRNAVGRWTFSWRRDSSRPNDGCLRGGGCSRAPAGGAVALCASSNGDGDRLLKDSPAVGFVDQFPIGFQNQLQGLFKIPLHLGQGSSLGVGSWNLFHETDIALAAPYIDGRELTYHDPSLTAKPILVNRDTGTPGWLSGAGFRGASLPGGGPRGRIQRGAEG